MKHLIGSVIFLLVLCNMCFAQQYQPFVPWISGGPQSHQNATPQLPKDNTMQTWNGIQQWQAESQQRSQDSYNQWFGNQTPRRSHNYYVIPNGNGGYVIRGY